ncbi:hypothetical protein [Schaalia sp. lx-100]|uniref:hypothetical protein n=1 Tax=Schaalia sp. lx-100 TaxID=2899081 RepID=UPI001E31407E|nr:hypothetical protein [Schaalia sp. lx-100]MCD4557966.1 hypothetical protein [Schaalia sp. lx-100]
MKKSIRRSSTVLLTALLVLGVTNVGWSAVRGGVIGCTANQAGESYAYGKWLVYHTPPGDPQTYRVYGPRDKFRWTYEMANVNRGGRWQVSNPDLTNGYARCVVTGTLR